LRGTGWPSCPTRPWAPRHAERQAPFARQPSLRATQHCPATFVKLHEYALICLEVSPGLGDHETVGNPTEGSWGMCRDGCRDEWVGRAAPDRPR